MKKNSNKKIVHRATVGSRNAAAVEMQLQEIKLYTCEEYEGVELRDPIQDMCRISGWSSYTCEVIKTGSQKNLRLEIKFAYCPTNEGQNPDLNFFPTCNHFLYHLLRVLQRMCIVEQS